MFHKLHVLGMNDDLWDEVRGVGIKLLIISGAHEKGLPIGKPCKYLHQQGKLMNSFTTLIKCQTRYT